MKDLKEFKYQYQLDATNQFRKPPSRLALGSGILLGVLAVGILWPVASKWVAKERQVAQAMPAQKLILPTDSPKNVDEAKPMAQETTTAPPLAEAPIQTAASAAKKVIPPPTAKVSAHVKAVPKLAMPLKKSAKYRERKALIAKVGTPAAAVSAPKASNSVLEERGTVLTAQDIQSKTDAALLTADNGSTIAADTGVFITIPNTQYEKSTLAACKARCLLKAKDAKGAPINAVISGPNFADILQEHQGTINLTGKKVVVKKHEIFMVQSITFNLPTTQKPMAQGLKSPTSQPKTPYKGTPQAYEDLSSESGSLR